MNPFERRIRAGQKRGVSQGELIGINTKLIEAFSGSTPESGAVRHIRADLTDCSVEELVEEIVRLATIVERWSSDWQTICQANADGFMNKIKELEGFIKLVNPGNFGRCTDCEPGEVANAIVKLNGAPLCMQHMEERMKGYGLALRTALST